MRQRWWNHLAFSSLFVGIYSRRYRCMCCFSWSLLYISTCLYLYLLWPTLAVFCFISLRCNLCVRSFKAIAALMDSLIWTLKHIKRGIELADSSFFIFLLLVPMSFLYAFKSQAKRIFFHWSCSCYLPIAGLSLLGDPVMFSNCLSLYSMLVRYINLVIFLYRFELSALCLLFLQRMNAYTGISHYWSVNRSG